MALEGFECRQCGHCCLNSGSAFQTYAIEEDIRLWEEIKSMPKKQVALDLMIKLRGGQCGEGQ